MACFLTDAERAGIRAGLTDPGSLTSRFFAALQRRVGARVATGNLLGPGAAPWYYPAAEYLSDAALLHHLQPDEPLKQWLRRVTLDIARRSADEWVGPAFRSHAEPRTGHLETAHLCWALASVYDLGTDVFGTSEKEEIRRALTEKGIPLCQRWLDQNAHLANWRGVMTAGVVVAAAVLGETQTLDASLPEWSRCTGAFQPDGSYGESLQYGNYLAFALALAYESVCRRFPARAALLDVSAYGKGLGWIASSMLYAKPLSGWGEEPRARAANFNDSAALHRPSGDLLLHLAVRSPARREVGLARGLFDAYYAPVPDQGPHDLATFGMRNDWGFLTLPLLTHPTEPLTPLEAGLPPLAAFSNGHCFMRDAWDGQTVVAINGGGDPLHGPGHLHGDLNSFILVHRRERLLADPGHSCYRNLIHGLESSSQTHNTCTFLVKAEALGLQEDRAKATVLEQRSVLPRRLLTPGPAGKPVPGPPVNRGNRRLIADEGDGVRVVGAEVAAAYGEPIRQFTRLWLLAGAHVLFVVDRIEAARPVTTTWNWLVNNRDGRAVVESQPNCLTIRRHGAGLKLAHGGHARLDHPVNAYVHDAYHVEPAQPGEGRPGSGLLYRWTETTPAPSRTVVHAIAMDEACRLDTWQLVTSPQSYTLANDTQQWTLDTGEAFRLVSGHGRVWIIQPQNGQWTLRH
ncbi:MAG: heparinase II/III family protein [Ferruginibacter sp.]|nr:heparinase II/III family protein [Cytophagales bacterium]